MPLANSASTPALRLPSPANVFAMLIYGDHREGRQLRLLPPPATVDTICPDIHPAVLIQAILSPAPVALSQYGLQTRYRTS